MVAVSDLEHVRSLDAMWHVYRASKPTAQTLVKIRTSVARDMLNARYYDSMRGQFLSQDPVFLSSSQNFGDPQSLDSYSYSEGNPITKSDPNGRTAFTAGAEGSFWNGTGSFGVNIDQYGIDYYYSVGLAAGVHVGANAGMTTDNLLNWTPFVGPRGVGFKV